mmetsp:Transcript_91221/g.195675  ORF Transcript_91221/g.195675 Transcript_91221/m.195675 type:complete len:217 (-) Transcript_91221:7-657(-)
MEPLHSHGLISGSSTLEPSSKQMRHNVVASSPIVSGSAVQNAPLASSSLSSGCGAESPHAEVTNCFTRNLNRPNLMMSFSVSLWPQVARSRTTSHNFFELLEGAALSTQKLPSRCARRSMGSPPGGSAMCSESIWTSVPLRTNLADLGAVKVLVCKWCASKSNRSCESRAQVLDTTCTAGPACPSPVRSIDGVRCRDRPPWGGKWTAPALARVKRA